MALISTKITQDIAIAITNSQSEHRVQQGTMQLKYLRERNDFQIGLAAFLSQCHSLNDKLFALLELKRMAQIDQYQTFFVLKDLYFEDTQKMAVIVRDIFCHHCNVKWISKLLDWNFQMLGGMAQMRYIQLLFSLVTKGRQSQAIRLNLQILQTVIIELVDCIVQNELLLRMLTIILALLFEYASENYFSRENLIETWRKFNEKIKFYNTPILETLNQIIECQLQGKKSKINVEVLQSILTSNFVNLFKRNDQEMKYYVQEFRLVCKYIEIFHSEDSIFSFVAIFASHSREKNKKLLQEMKFSEVHPLLDYLGLEQQGQPQNIFFQCLYQLMTDIFTKHYNLLEQAYINQGNRSFFLYLVPLLTICNEPKDQTIIKWIIDHIPKLVDNLGSFLSRLKFQNKKSEEDEIDFVSIWQFLVRFKSHIEIEMFPHICNLMQEISLHSCNLSQLCYLFIEQVRPDMESLDHCTLCDFLVGHLRSLNANVWDHKFSNYSCFLYLAETLQTTYQVIRNLSYHQQLHQESLKAQKIMIEILEEENGNIKDGQLNLLVLLIQVTSYLMGDQKDWTWQKFNAMKGETLCKAINRFNFDDSECEKLLKFYNLNYTHELREEKHRRSQGSLQLIQN